MFHYLRPRKDPHLQQLLIVPPDARAPAGAAGDGLREHGHVGHDDDPFVVVLSRVEDVPEPRELCARERAAGCDVTPEQRVGLGGDEARVVGLLRVVCVGVLGPEERPSLFLRREGGELSICRTAAGRSSDRCGVCPRPRRRMHTGSAQAAKRQQARAGRLAGRGGRREEKHSPARGRPRAARGCSSRRSLAQLSGGLRSQRNRCATGEGLHVSCGELGANESKDK